MSEYEPREFAIKGTLHAPESVGAEQLAESLKRGLEQSRLGATVDLGDFTKYATDDAEDEGGCPCDRCGKHHPATTCAEPEDKDDLYVEPEPLKEGDWVQVWAQVNRLADDDGDLLLVSTAFGEAAPVSTKFYARNDAIVRPAEGQMPPWVTVATANVAALAKALMEEGGMEHDAAFKTAESLDRAGIRAEGGAS